MPSGGGVDNGTSFDFSKHEHDHVATSWFRFSFSVSSFVQLRLTESLTGKWFIGHEIRGYFDDGKKFGPAVFRCFYVSVPCVRLLGAELPTESADRISRT
jgi:hypothetical protein